MSEAEAKPRPVVVYKPDVKVDFRGHVFPVEKYGQTYLSLLKSGLIDHVDLMEPKKPARADLLLVHQPGYVADFMCSARSPRMFSSELPIADDIRDFFLYTTGGSILAVSEALARRGTGINLGGGFHHAFPGHAEGFCYLHDIAIAIKRAKKEGLVTRVLVVDCDVHQGNGTAVIFADDPDVFTFSIHQEHNYPVKQKSDLDIGLEDFTGDDEYLGHLKRVVPMLLEEHKPELVFFVAGADPYKDDQLGGLKLTKHGLRERDQLVIGHARRRSIPVAIAFAGGYSINPKDVPEIHFNTCRVAIELG